MCHVDIHLGLSKPQWSIPEEGESSRVLGCSGTLQPAAHVKVCVCVDVLTRGVAVAAIWRYLSIDI